MDMLSSTSVLQNPSFFLRTNINRMYVSVYRYDNRYTSCNRVGLKVESFIRNSFQKFIHFALDETTNKTHLTPSPLQDKYSSTIAIDGKTELEMLSFQAPKIRLLRSLSIENETMQLTICTTCRFGTTPSNLLMFGPHLWRATSWQQVQTWLKDFVPKVLDLAVLPKPEFDLPIFCANFFTTNNMNIVVLDLNPLYNVTDRMDYKDKYYKNLMPLGLKYTKLLPWGGKLTSESLLFFSPIVIWTRFSSSHDNYDVLYSAFVEYYEAWLDMMDKAAEETNISRILMNCEAQHKYLTWRTEKDPGHRILKKLIGDAHAKDLVKNFLFNGVDELGTKTFLDYFPEYACEDGKINEKRSIIGKSFEHRPWNSLGEFVANR